MAADFTPNLNPYSGQGSFRFWVQKVLPLVYDDSLSYYELLCKVVTFLNNVIQDMDTAEENIELIRDAYNQLQNYVNTYFDNLDIEAELDAILMKWVEDGRLEDALTTTLTDNPSLLDGPVSEAIPGVVSEQLPGVVAEQIDAVVDAAIDGQVPPAVSDWLDANVEPVGSAVVVDKSLSISGAAADAKITGEYIGTISEGYEPTVVTDGLNVTNAGITITKITDESVRMYGTGTGTRRFTFLNGQSIVATTTTAFSKTLDAGWYLITASNSGYRENVRIDGTYSTFANSFAVANTTDYPKVFHFTQDVMLGIITGNGYNYGTSEEPTIVTFKAEKISANDAIARAQIENIPNLEPMVNNLKNVSAINLVDNSEHRSTAGTSAGISYIFNVNESKISFSGTASGTSFFNFFGSLEKLRNGVIPGGYLHIKTNGLVKNTIGLHIYTLPSSEIKHYTYLIYEDSTIYIPPKCTAFLIRLEIAGGTSAEGEVEVEVYNSLPASMLSNAQEEDGLKILVFGNSFSYSTLNYLGLTLREIVPNKHMIVGILYQSGATISDHLTNWNNNTNYTTYSRYDSASGRYDYSSNAVSGKDAVYFEKWDYIIFQNTAANGTNPSTYSNLETLANNISNYINYPVTFLYNIQQSKPINAPASSYPAKYRDETLYPTGKDRSDGMLMDQLSYVQTLMNDCIISDIIPTGVAVQNARTTSLNELGDYGSLSYDETGHLQNGLPMLIGAYTAAYKFCELAGWKAKLFANPFTPTDESLSAVGYNSGHGDCVGVTNSNKLLAQKCALMAIKKPYEITEI